MFFGGRVVLQQGHRLGIAAGLEIVDGQIDRDDIVALGQAFDAGDPDGHQAFVDQGHRTVGGQGLLIRANRASRSSPSPSSTARPWPARVLVDIVALHVLARMAGDGDVVVVDEQLDLEVAGHGIAGGLGVVAFHLRAVAAEHHQRSSPDRPRPRR